MSKQADERIEVSPTALAQAWRAVGHRIAVIAASATAFVSLLQHTPVHIASFRGALVWAATLTTTSMGAWLAQKTWNAPSPHPKPEDT